MITIKLRAADVRTLQKAQTEAELRGCVDMMLHKVKIHEQEREFVKAEKEAPKEEKFTVRNAVDILVQALGKDATMPPFPGSAYFNRIRQIMTAWAMDEDYVKALAKKVAETLQPPYQISWVFQNHERIMAGKVFGQGRAQHWRSSDKPKTGPAAWHGGTLDTPMEG